MLHYRKTINVYRGHNKSDTMKDVCTFCNEDNLPRVTGENKTMFIMPNRVSYDMFEGRRVIDHLMVIPKRHAETVAEFSDQEKIDQMTIIGEYEARGYNTYARGVATISRSVKHQHTHLIKLVDKKSKAVVFLSKPYVLFDI
jgi:diadenosine tetraphosphate (Ap4A) HIT family hydrolase